MIPMKSHAGRFQPGFHSTLSTERRSRQHVPHGYDKGPFRQLKRQIPCFPQRYFRPVLFSQNIRVCIHFARVIGDIIIR
jgi:hypothetical protein